MSDYLSNLAARNFDLSVVVQPRPVSLFESSVMAGPSPAVDTLKVETVTDEPAAPETSPQAVSPTRAPAEHRMVSPPQGFSGPPRDPEVGDGRDDQSAIRDRPREGPKEISPPPTSPLTGPEPPIRAQSAVEPAVPPAQPRPVQTADALASGPEPAPGPLTPAAWTRPLPQVTPPGPPPGRADPAPSEDVREPSITPPRPVAKVSRPPVLESVVREIVIERVTSKASTRLEPTLRPSEPATAPEPATVVARPQPTPLGWVEPGQPALAEPAPPPEPTIQVTIGRLEVRATPPTPAPRKQRRQPPVMSLDEYLRQRAEGDRK